MSGMKPLVQEIHVVLITGGRGSMKGTQPLCSVLTLPENSAENKILGWIAAIPHATSLRQFILGTWYGKYIKHLNL